MSVSHPAVFDFEGKMYYILQILLSSQVVSTCLCLHHSI